MPLTDKSPWTLDPRAGGSSIPPEVQLHIAGYLLSEDIVPEAQQHAILARLLLVSRTFLHFGMGELYGIVSLKASEDSVSLLRQMRSSPRILPYLSSIVVDFDCGHVSWADPSRHVGSIHFSHELRMLSTSAKIQELKVQWAHTCPTRGQRSELLQLTPHLDSYGEALLHTWSSIAANIRAFHLHICVNALPFMASFRGSFAPMLSSFELRIYGGVCPDDHDEPALEDALNTVAENFIIGKAQSLEKLYLFLESNGRPAGPNLQVDRFFKAISKSIFPKMASLSIQTGFINREHGHVSNLINALVKQGTLTTLSLKPSLAFSFFDPSGIPVYHQMLRTHGPRWSGLKNLALHGCLSSTYVRRDSKTGVSRPALTGLLLANPTLQVFHLDGDYMGAEDLSSILACLSAVHLHTLTIYVQSIRPSTYDELASSLPSLRTLHLRLCGTAPDGPYLDRLVRAIADEEAVGSKIPDNPWDLQGKRSEHLEDLTTEAHERTFLNEMEHRRYDSWDLREASVHYNLLPHGCDKTSYVTGAESANDAAEALKSSVPGLVSMDVQPKRWPKFWLS